MFFYSQCPSIYHKPSKNQDIITVTALNTEQLFNAAKHLKDIVGVANNVDPITLLLQYSEFLKHGYNS